jgi:hypothetical protein
MNTGRWLLLFNLAAGFYGVGNVWLVQLTCYPLWTYVGPAEYEAYHNFWWHSIWGDILFPSVLAFLGAIAMLRWRPFGVPKGALWLGVGLQVLLWVLTALMWGRWMAQLIQVSGPVYGALFHKMLVTHWLRVAIVTGYGILQFWIVSVSLREPTRETSIRAG